MNSSTQIANSNNYNSGALFEKVMLKSDLAGLSPVETVQHIKNVCDSLGLNALTNPIEVIEFQGKKKLYVRKEATEQLRLLRKVSIEKLETKVHEGGLYTVTAYAITPDGRKDSSTGAVSINGLKGDALGNAMMKAETKAKRRVTLSICGMGFMDESETESIPYAKKVNVTELKEQPLLIDETSELDLKADLERINSCSNIDDLKNAFMAASSYWQKRKDINRIKIIIDAKDKRKSELDMQEFNAEIDAVTGEVNGQ